MTSRIGKRTREAAIHCLEQCASDRIGGVPGACCTWDVYSHLSAAESAIEDAANKAFGTVLVSSAVLPLLSDKYLEAAALLRDGWNPGDPVEVRR